MTLDCFLGGIVFDSAIFDTAFMKYSANFEVQTAAQIINSRIH